MLNEEDADIIGWEPSGASFRIKNWSLFSLDVLPKYCDGEPVHEIRLTPLHQACAMVAARSGATRVSLYALTMLAGNVAGIHCRTHLKW